MVTDGAASVTMVTPSQSGGQAEECLKMGRGLRGEVGGSTHHLGANASIHSAPSVLLSSVLSSFSADLSPPPSSLTSVSPSLAHTHSKHSMPFSSAASSDHHAQAPSLAILSAPSQAQPTPHSSSAPLCSRSYDADHDGCVHMTRLTYISTSLGVRPHTPTPP